jgi:hypothetical protein
MVRERLKGASDGRFKRSHFPGRAQGHKQPSSTSTTKSDAMHEGQGNLAATGGATMSRDIVAASVEPLVWPLNLLLEPYKEAGIDIVCCPRDQPQLQ